MLKTRATAKSAAAFLFALILAPAAIHAQKPPTPVVAVVDYQVILRDSTAIKSVRDQAEEERQKLQASATDQEKKLRASTENLEKQRAVLSPEAFAQKQRELQTELAEFRRQFQLRRRQLDQAFAEADQKFQDTLVVIVEEIAQEKGYNMVFNKMQMIFSAKQYDITDLALQRLNKKLPTLKVNVPTQ